MQEMSVSHLLAIFTPSTGYSFLENNSGVAHTCGCTCKKKTKNIPCQQSKHSDLNIEMNW